MKKWILKLTMALLIALTLSLPSFAWQDHGGTYTAIDALDSERFTAQGEVSLPTLSNQFALGLHVDIVDDLAFLTMPHCFMTSTAMDPVPSRTVSC